MDTIGIEELAALPEAPVIDVREPDEFASGHKPGAVPLPLGEVEQRIGEIAREGRVYVICASGRRSARAAELMRGHGIDAVSVEGGTQAWASAGHPIDREP